MRTCLASPTAARAAPRGAVHASALPRVSRWTHSASLSGDSRKGLHPARYRPRGASEGKGADTATGVSQPEAKRAAENDRFRCCASLGHSHFCTAPRTTGRRAVRTEAWKKLANKLLGGSSPPSSDQSVEAPPKPKEKVVEEKSDGGFAPVPEVDNLDVVLFQTFGWESSNANGSWWDTIASRAEDIAASGATHAWLPPPSQSVDRAGYLPGQLYNLQSNYGGPEAMANAVKALRSAKLSPIIDIVINHRCADKQNDDGSWTVFSDIDPRTGQEVNWGKWAITGDDPDFGGQGNPDTGEDYGPAPDLDHLNEDLQNAIIRWLTWLRDDFGAVGWRFDFARGYGAEFIKKYIAETVTSKAFNVGEFWTDLQWEGSTLGANQNAARQALCDWLDAGQAHSHAFDFPTKGIVQEAAKNCEYWRLRDGEGKPSGLMGWWPAMAVTFIDNHDTGSSQQHWPWPGDLVGAGYAYILTHPGVPTVFWEHYFDWGEELQKTIKDLVAARKRNGVRADSAVRIDCADPDMYVAHTTGEKGELVCKMGPRPDMGDLVPPADQGWTMVASGKDFAVWEKPN
ncbi:unnamed protein product [Pedinophyceae sp. YPF-701]|nr:unnamed protein product [Pedinophyceae sp. YPF-701]